MTFTRSDFKISFGSENTEFFVNEKKGTVVCILTGILDTPKDYDNSTWIPNKFFKEKGIAKCAEGDVFDVERGKRIALAKAENRIYLSALRYIESYIKPYEYVINAFNEFSDKAYHTCAHNDDYIASLSYEAHPRYVKELKPMKRCK